MPSPNARPLLLLRERFLWMGPHSGYDQVFEHVTRRWTGPVTNTFRTRSGVQNFIWTPLAMASGPTTPFYNGDSAAAEWALERSMRRSGAGVAHIAYVENNLRRLAEPRRRHGVRLVGTVHQPAEWWRTRHRRPDLLGALDALIVLCRDQAEYFEAILPGAVHLVRHGVDAGFFCPEPLCGSGDGDAVDGARCVFAGTWMRDHAALRRVVDAVLARCPEVHVDMIVPVDKRRDTDLEKLAGHSRVAWHAGLADEALRAVYRSARLLLLPLTDCAANNGLLEAMACALPVVTNDVGGIREYTDASFADRLPRGDVDGMIDATIRLLQDPAAARARGRHARQFCLDQLAWSELAGRTLAIYDRL